jgi:hypothetical protein
LRIDFALIAKQLFTDIALNSQLLRSECAVIAQRLRIDFAAISQRSRNECAAQRFRIFYAWLAEQIRPHRVTEFAQPSCTDFALNSQLLRGDSAAISQ